MVPDRNEFRFEQQISSGREGVLAPFVCNQQNKKDAHLHAAEKIDVLCKITVQLKKKTSDHEVCHLFADISVCLINYDKSVVRCTS